MHIADTLGISEATVRYRVKNLIDSGVISKFTVLLDPKKIGYSTTGILMVKIAPDQFEETSERISELTETYHVFQNTGGDNVFIMKDLSKGNHQGQYHGQSGVDGTGHKIGGENRGVPAGNNPKGEIP